MLIDMPHCHPLLGPLSRKWRDIGSRGFPWWALTAGAAFWFCIHWQSGFCWSQLQCWSENQSWVQSDIAVSAGYSLPLKMDSGLVLLGWVVSPWSSRMGQNSDQKCCARPSRERNQAGRVRVVPVGQKQGEQGHFGVVLYFMLL